MDSHQLRTKFFNFFTARHHQLVQSSSLIPAQDPTLLFTNAGMNQFKDMFLGKEKRSYSRAVSIQKCVRAGGKHNDLDNVGFTKRHLTFFEMMGNFSFGDYFKKDAIQFAWDFLTKEVGLPQEKLYASVFREDQEAYDIWHKVIGLPEDRIVRLDEADNFWQMGDTGPCGPCSEIYIDRRSSAEALAQEDDRGPSVGCGQRSCKPGCSCDRFLEIWNLVFMQFDRQPNGSDKPLAQTGVDTGMGLERLCAVVQDKDSVFQTDLFTPIIQKIEQLTNLSYAQQDDKTKAAFHVLADHIRSSSLIISDGGSPANEGRGYVLRKIIRRAALFAQKLSDQKNIFPELVDPVAQIFGDIYPDLAANKEKIKSILRSEVEKFSANLVRGQAILADYMRSKKASDLITGQEAFKLYDTFGFPVELIRVIANEHGFGVDFQGFEKEMEKQREQSGKKQEAQVTVELPATTTTVFTGYQEIETTAPITALIHDNQLVDSVPAGSECWVITQASPFYVEGGGQVSDTATISWESYETNVLELKRFNGAIGARIITPSNLKVEMKVRQQVDAQARLNTMKNHTATHLLQAALIKIFGKQIKQSGSLVEPDYLRFDFTYHENLRPADIKQVEDLVNAVIMANIPLSITQSTHKEATDRGVIAFFGEKYNPEKVRVVEVPGFSAELCGGTHVRATGDIGCLKITEISALSAGNRRLVAVTGPKAVERFQEDFAIIKSLCQEFKAQPHQLIDTVHKQAAQMKALQTELKQLKKQQMAAQIPTWLQQVTMIGKMPFLMLELPDASMDELRDLTQQLSKKKAALYFLVSSTDEKSNFIASLSPEFEKQVNMKAFQEFLQKELGLRGGGSGLTLQGGGPRYDRNWHQKIQDWLFYSLGVCTSTRD